MPDEYLHVTISFNSNREMNGKINAQRVVNNKSPCLNTSEHFIYHDYCFFV